MLHGSLTEHARLASSDEEAVQEHVVKPTCAPQVEEDGEEAGGLSEAVGAMVMAFQHGAYDVLSNQKALQHANFTHFMQTLKVCWHAQSKSSLPAYSVAELSACK